MLVEPRYSNAIPSQQRVLRCPTKHAYPDWLAAEQAALQLQDDVHRGIATARRPGAILAYRCQVCSNYHIGHTTGHQVRSRWSQAGAVFVEHTPAQYHLPIVRAPRSSYSIDNLYWSTVEPRA